MELLPFINEPAVVGTTLFLLASYVVWETLAGVRSNRHETWQQWPIIKVILLLAVWVVCIAFIVSSVGYTSGSHGVVIGALTVVTIVPTALVLQDSSRQQLAWWCSWVVYMVWVPYTLLLWWPW